MELGATTEGRASRGARPRGHNPGTWQFFDSVDLDWLFCWLPKFSTRGPGCIANHFSVLLKTASVDTPGYQVGRGATYRVARWPSSTATSTTNITELKKQKKMFESLLVFFEAVFPVIYLRSIEMLPWNLWYLEHCFSKHLPKTQERPTKGALGRSTSVQGGTPPRGSEKQVATTNAVLQDSFKELVLKWEPTSESLAHLYSCFWCFPTSFVGWFLNEAVVRCGIIYSIMFFTLSAFGYRS